MKRPFISVLFVLCLLCLIPTQYASAAEIRSITVPMEVLRTKHITVSIKVNDVGPFRLVFDTGAPYSFISGRAAEKIGLISAEQAKQPAFFGMRGQKTVNAFSVGDVRVKDLSLMILDHPLLEWLSDVEGPIDGIVGFNFFARFRTTIDYAASQLTFAPVDYQPPDVLSNLMARVMNPQPTKKVIAPSALWGMVVDKSDEAQGVLVKQVFPQSAAEAAGLRVGDRLTAINERWTESVADCYEAASFVKAGQTATLKLLRDGKEVVLQLRPRAGV